MDVLMSFSQEYEDIVLYHMLKKIKEPIYYIDVGANDPLFISVTKLFSIMGGYGINIEPQHAYILKLEEDRPMDVNLEMGISDKKGMLKLYGEGPGASFCEDIVENMSYREVPVMTLADVCNTYVPKGQKIHFLKIDVENFERQCLLGMDFKTYRPYIVCMESTVPSTDIPNWESWEDILLSQEYEFAGMIGINRYYVAKECKTILNDFCDVSSLKRKYEIWNYLIVKENARRRAYLAKLPSPIKRLMKFFLLRK